MKSDRPRYETLRNTLASIDLGGRSTVLKTQQSPLGQFSDAIDTLARFSVPFVVAGETAAGQLGALKRPRSLTVAIPDTPTSFDAVQKTMRAQSARLSRQSDQGNSDQVFQRWIWPDRTAPGSYLVDVVPVTVEEFAKVAEGTSTYGLASGTRARVADPSGIASIERQKPAQFVSGRVIRAIEGSPGLAD